MQKMDQLVKQEIIKEKRFSIIVAAYNIEDYIQRAIESVEKQTLKNYELIVVNDASTDRTGEIIENLSSKYDNIVYLKHNENKRLGAARNTALKVAKGEYIIFLDGDDYLAAEDVLEKLDKLIGEDKTDVVYLGFKIQGDREELVIPNETICTRTYKAATDKYPNVWSKCWRKALLDENNIEFPEYRFYEDVLFNYKGIMKAKSFKMTDYPVHIYISGRANSITTTLSFKNVYDTINNIEEMIKIRQEEPTEEIDIIIKKEINMCKKRLEMVTQKK